ncbi:transposase [Streptococcus pyogenes]|uniref:IS66 family transposase n=1 Tax=Streptococcus pyogenes TaxID=1314 RepID=UPI0004F8FD85|nr:transposase [Streptococcus pyogenes]AIQ00879.1 hypothetical protein FE90_0110 [Streptococcus pyogenes]SQF50689.1 putative transposase remnant (pseudogene) [Streptococcus pyogenes]HEQ3166736.1 transposase [Streptococcus pyogenes]HER0758904.1 transposase [Streptococcus pyogenes]HER0858206.1 transposase [Streptococcus pyogenes]
MSLQDKVIKTQDKTIETMANELALLREQVAYLTQKLYEKSSEKAMPMTGQLSLFDQNQLPEEADDLPSGNTRHYL